MTQPPDPYQQFPGQQPGGYPQQPGGYPQQPGYPPQGGYPQQGGWGPQGPYGPQGGPPPKKSPLPWILGGVGGLLVIGGAVTAIILLTGDDDNGGGSDGGGGGSTPQDTANAIASAMNAHDVDALLAVTCPEFRSYIGGNRQDLQEDLSQVSDVKVRSVQEQGPDKAQVVMSFTEQDDSGPDAEEEKMTLTKRDGTWTWCESVPESPGGPGSTPGGEAPTFSQGPPPQVPDPN